ncbi:MAG: hypothetical protein V4582_07370 [Pseudomonadota bacterium]
MKSTSLIALLLATAFAAPAFAQTPAAGVSTPRIDQREVQQQKRIANGVETGQLTPKETLNLEKREVKVESDKQMAKADGHVTAAERSKITREQNRDSRKIHQKKHNRKAAPATPA